MLLLRLGSLAALFFGLYQVSQSADGSRAGDLDAAFWLACCLVLGLVAAVLWAPALADRILEPPGTSTTEARMVDPPGRLMALIRRQDARGSRRLVRWLCFVEGVRHPWRPGPFVIGLRNAKPGSWLELAFAKEVYRFTNVENCVRAYEVLRRHGRRPAPHPRDAVNEAVAALPRHASRGER